ncbi:MULTISPECIES: DUF485 domain-containing protein [unclassified Pseudomonas]|uniref:DUF485 domain-containing protein n=1 Tax=unclassified Pseudomonas TaxID=196821 RepID=UPI002447C7F6|nr:MULTISPECIES: DUF485 domain-containing protein [unclassified Pseudomonas]MDH0301644.1 DUF485 domain-containing protein [Pseudomonas sp. GD04091]MDH1987246.1 DUF485 domain-containing protein [Pseudomonas sp. GD03689]
MTPEHIDSISNHPAFVQLIRRKRRLNGTLTLAMLVAYYGFVLLVAFAPGVLGQSLSGGVTSVGMLVGVLMVLLSFALTGIYMHRANRVIDPLNEVVRQECAQ